MLKLVTATILGVYLCATPLSAAEFIQCYDFGCKSKKAFSLASQQWSTISTLFSPQTVVDADSERQAIRTAIALFEKYAGQISGTHLDKAGNYPGYDIDKQMDCIDESTNTSQYLAAMQQRDLFRWHTVKARAHRIVWFFDHWTAVISENGSDQQYAVDSWYRDNGQMPLLQRLPDWQRKMDFEADLNPELAETY